MHRTTMNFPEALFRRAKLKAASQGLALSQVVRKLVDRWTRDEIALEPPGSRQELAERARASFGIWDGRDPDRYLRESRRGLARRDSEVEDARLDAR